MNKIIDRYIEAALNYDEGTRDGDSKKTNSSYKRLDSIFRELKNKNELNLLLPLGKHENMGVRLWSGTHLLPFNQEVGIKVLSEIALSDNLYGFDAKMTMQEWKKGNLTYLIE